MENARSFKEQKHERFTRWLRIVTFNMLGTVWGKSYLVARTFEFLVSSPRIRRWAFSRLFSRTDLYWQMTLPKLVRDLRMVTFPSRIWNRIFLLVTSQPHNLPGCCIEGVPGILVTWRRRRGGRRNLRWNSWRALGTGCAAWAQWAWWPTPTWPAWGRRIVYLQCTTRLANLLHMTVCPLKLILLWRLHTPLELDSGIITIIV